MGKGPNWWELAYPVLEGGNGVHTFFRDMWHGMHDGVYIALREAVNSMKDKGNVPEEIVITGFRRR
jgi:hypothetical protein